MVEKFKVLVIDDESGMCSGVIRILKDCTLELEEVNLDVCFDVLQAHSAEQGLEIMETQLPDILLLDHKLPGMSGIDLLDRIAEKKMDVLVIMMTAYASLETAVEATKKGAYDFLAKPFSPAELKHMIRKASSRIIYKRQARELAEEKNRLRFQFISILSHELKSPLAAIQGYLDITKDKILGNDITAYEHIIDRSLIRLEAMRKLIFDLLDMTRIESQQKKRRFSDVKIYEIVQKVIENCQFAAKEHNITIHTDIQDNLEITADPGEIEMIFNNLISNAVKYNEDNGKVEITAGECGDKIVITVRDTGIGLTPQDVAKLFQEFVRIKNDKTRNILGSGLGLSLVKKLVQLYDGDISVESEFGKGSCFKVELPKNISESVSANES